MHIGLLYWTKTGVVYAANADYACTSYTKSGGDNLENKPQAYGVPTCLWPVWLFKEIVANVGLLDFYTEHPSALSPAQGLSQSDRLLPVVYRNLTWILEPTQDLASVSEITCRARDVGLVSPNLTRRKQRKGEGQRITGRSARGVKMRRADRLSKRYFRMCSWNCASANILDVDLENMDYDFDVVCLQETWTCPNLASSASRLHSHSEASRPWFGTSSSERS